MLTARGKQQTSDSPMRIQGREARAPAPAVLNLLINQVHLCCPQLCYTPGISKNLQLYTVFLQSLWPTVIEKERLKKKKKNPVVPLRSISSSHSGVACTNVDHRAFDMSVDQWINWLHLPRGLQPGCKSQRFGRIFNLLGKFLDNDS